MRLGRTDSGERQILGLRHIADRQIRRSRRSRSLHRRPRQAHRNYGVCIPRHVTQRGNRRQQTFFQDADYALYRDLLTQSAEKAGAHIWSYHLMLNQVHVIVLPSEG